MSQVERNNMMEKLWDKTKLTKDQVIKMSDAEVEYFHWLYFEESIYDLM